MVLKREYPWPRPARCPSCRSTRIWGHGYVGRYIQNYDGLELKTVRVQIRQYRCNDCKVVVRCLPEGYFMRFQISRRVIQKSILQKTVGGVWLAGISSTRQNHWFQALKRQTLARWGNRQLHMIIAFDVLIELGVVPVSRGKIIPVDLSSQHHRGLIDHPEEWWKTVSDADIQASVEFVSRPP